MRHRDGTPLNLTPRVFRALLLFVENPGDLLSKDTLLLALWPGLVVEENNLSQVVSALCRALGDDTQGSRYIQTVPRQGFRFVAKATVLPDQEMPAELPAAPPVALPTELPATRTDAEADTVRPSAHAELAPGPPPQPPRRPWLRAALAGSAALALGGGAWWLLRRPPAGARAAGPATLAVLPFRPLTTEGRDELLELGMADAPIARLSTVPGLVVRSVGAALRLAGTDQDPLRAARDLDVQ